MFLRAKSSLGSKNKIFIADFLTKPRTKRKFCFTNKNVLLFLFLLGINWVIMC